MHDAIHIVDQLFSDLDPHAACILVQSAAAGIMGFRLSQLRVGALYWPNRLFPTDGSFGWGVMGNGSHFQLEHTAVDENGSFNGHTWIEAAGGFIIDALYDVDCGPPTLTDDRGSVVRAYFHRPLLERSVKRFWRERMQTAHKAGRAARTLATRLGE